MTECLTPEDFDALRNEVLSPHRSQDIRLHIAACDACRQEWEAFERIDALIVEDYSEIEPRAEWLADMQAMLAVDSTRVDTQRILVTHRSNHFTVLSFAITTAALILIAAILAPWFFKSDNKQPLGTTGTVAQDSNSANTTDFAPIDRSVDVQGSVAKEPTVLAHRDFLVGKHPGDDDEIELYWVLPVQRKH